MSVPVVLPSTAGASAPAVLLPYQQRWVADQSPLKVAEKSRRIGLTWGEAADNVLIAAADRSAGGQNCYYTGYNQDMAVEYIQACAMWARTFDRAASEVEEGIWDDGEADRQIKTYTITFPQSGHRIVALSSRPANLRGRQGVVVIDEAAFHDHLDELLKAAMALLIWGGRVRVISTHNGTDNPFNELITQIRSAKRRGVVHRTEFREAVEQGLYRRVCLRLGQAWTAEAEADWVRSVYDFYGEDAGEELDVIPKSGAGVFLSTVLIESRMVDAPVLRLAYEDAFAQASDADRESRCRDWLTEHLDPVLEQLDPGHRHHYGSDFGRSGHLSVLAPVAVGQDLVRRVPFLLEMRNVPFAQQEQVHRHVIDRLPRFMGGAMDARGNGQYLAERCAQRYGWTRIEQVMLSLQWYRDAMPKFKAAFEDATIEIPRSDDVRTDLRAIRMDKGVARVPDTAETVGTDGGKRHGDAAVALALGYHATLSDAAPIEWTPAPSKGETWGLPGAGLAGRGAW